MALLEREADSGADDGGEVGMTRLDIIRKLQEETLTLEMGKNAFPNTSRFGEALEAVKGAIELLKAQEPHVLTFDEIRQMKNMPVWEESKNGKVYVGWVLVYDIQNGMGIKGINDERLGMTRPDGHVSWWHVCDYGRTWRCWSARPTEEQRREEPWQE